MSRTALCLAFAGLLLSRLPAEAQDPSRRSSFSVEARGELALSTGELADLVDSDVGYGLGLDAKYWLGPVVAVYGGWDRFAFRSDSGTTRIKFTDSGFHLGVQLQRPYRSAQRLLPFVTGGLLLNRATLERSGAAEARRESSDRNVGFTFGGGVSVLLGRGIWLVPEARYRQHPVTFGPALGVDDGSHASYVGLNLGIVFHAFDGTASIRSSHH